MLAYSDKKFFWKYLALDFTANCICEIHCKALDGFNLNTVHPLSSNDNIFGLCRDLNQGLLDGKQECTQIINLLKKLCCKVVDRQK